MLLNPLRVLREVICLMLGIICLGQTLAFAFPPQQTTEHGIAKTLAGEINTVLQDERGFLWVGTEEGVFRYDGNVLMRSGELDPSFSWLDHIPVRNLLVDTKGRIWITSQEGTVVYEGPEVGMYLVEPLASLEITAWYEDKVDQFWIGADEKLYVFDLARNYLEPVNIPGQVTSITTLYKDKQDRLWIGTDAGLQVLYTPTMEFLDRDSFNYDRPIPRVTFFTEDANGTIWVGTAGDGLLKVNSEKSSSSLYSFQIEQSRGITSRHLTSIVVDADGHFLIGTEQHGIFRWDPLKQNETSIPVVHPHINYEAIYAGQYISALFQDKTGLLWIGTSSGLSKGPARSILPLDTRESQLLAQLDLGQAKSFAHDAFGNLWIGTFGQGVIRINLENGDYSKFVHNPEDKNTLIDNRVISIDVDRSQNVWIATHAGVSRYDIRNGEFKTYLRSEVPNHIIFRYVFISSKNEILIATENEGVLQYNPLNDQFERWAVTVDNEEGGGVYNVRHIIEDHHGLLWFAAGLDGLIRFDQSESVIRVINDGPSAFQVIRGHEVISVVRGTDSDIWAGTLAGGVFRISPDNEKIIQLKEEDGLPGNEVSCLLEDRNGYIWAASRGSLARIDPASNQIVRFGKHNGLVYDQVYYNACTRKEALMYIGSGQGVTVIDTENLAIDEPGPSVELADFQVGNKPHPFSHNSREISLLHNQNDLRFRFMIPDFLSPDENQLMYRLDGDEDVWKEADPGNVVSLSALEPGKYNLFVKAANHVGVWGKPVMYEVNIASLSQARWLNGVLIASGFLLVIGLMLRMHSKHKKQIQDLKKEYETLRDHSDQSAENIRSQIARDLHDDLGADLSRLVLSLENRLQRDDLSDFSRAWTRECWDYAQRITREVRHLSWAVDPDRNWLPDLVDRIYREAYDTMDIDKVEFRTSKIPRVFLPPSMRKDIFLIFREALTNISTHASAEKVRIHVNYREDLLELFVEDNGVGFEPERINEGNGLKNMRRRAQNLNARLTWENVPDGGTMVVLEVPLN